MKAWLAWAVATLFFAYQCVLRVLPGTMVNEIIIKYDITSSIFGQISGIYYIAYTLAHIPIGMMLDYLGPKKVISSCAFMLVLGMLPMVYTDSWMLLNFGRILIAMASSAGVLGVFKVLRMYFPVTRFAMLFGISVTIGYLGAVYAGQPLRHLIETIGMESALFYVICLGLVLAVLSFICIPDDLIKSSKSTASIFQDLKNLLVNKEWIYISFLGGFMIGPLEGFADGWSMQFLSVYYPIISSENAAFVSSLIFLGFAVCAPIIGYMAQKIDLKMYYAFTALLGLVMLCSFSVILIFKLSMIWLGFMFVLIGICSNYQTLVVIKSTMLMPAENASLVSACSNMIMMIFGYFFHTIISIVLNAAGSEYSEQIFIKSLVIIPVSITVALIGFIILHMRREKKSILKNTSVY